MDRTTRDLDRTTRDLDRTTRDLDRTTRDLDRTTRDLDRTTRDLDRTTRDRDRWKQRSEDLKKQLDEARRAGKRQAAPFAKDRPQGTGKRPGRRPGAQYGRQGSRRCPPKVDETHRASAPTACPDCGGAVEVTRVASQYQEELPRVRPIVRRFDIEVGRCSQCRQRVQGRHRLQTSDALGAAAVQFGPGLASLVVELHTEMGVPLAKVAGLLRTRFGLEVTAGGLVHLLHRTARDAAPVYRELCRQVRNAPVDTPDETGWRVSVEPHWLWTFVTPDTTVYAICPGRGFADAATVLGTDYAGVLVRDGWQVYRRYKGSLHQSCLNHLLQCCKKLEQKHPYSPWGSKVKAVLQTGLDLRDRCRNGELTRHGLDSLRGRLEARLGRLIDAPPPLKDAKRFAKHLANEFPAVFLFLRDPVDRRHQLAGRTGHPPRGGHPQGMRRQPHPQGRRHSAGAVDRGAYRPSAPPRPADADGRDVARPPARHSRGFRAPAAARVGGCDARTALSPHRFPRLDAAAPHAPIRGPSGQDARGARAPRATWSTTFTDRPPDGSAACHVKPTVVVATVMNPTRQPNQPRAPLQIPAPSS